MSRKELKLEEKINLIKDHKNNMNQVCLAKKYEISRKQVYNIIKNSENIIQAIQNNFSKSRKRLKVTTHESSIDKAVWLWFQKARSMRIPISGPIIHEKALKFAKELNLTEFKASNGWLQRFKGRHNICKGTFSGESCNVNPETVSNWISNIPHLIQNYAMQDIFNFDETALFFEAYQIKL